MRKKKTRLQKDILEEVRKENLKAFVKEQEKTQGDESTQQKQDSDTSSK